MAGLERVFFGARMSKLEQVVYVLGLALLFLLAAYMAANHGNVNRSVLVWAVALFAVGMVIRMVIRIDARRKAST